MKCQRRDIEIALSCVRSTFSSRVGKHADAVAEGVLRTMFKEVVFRLRDNEVAESLAFRARGSRYELDHQKVEAVVVQVSCSPHTVGGRG